MSIEQKLRDNLKAAADGLIVPQPKVKPLPRRVPTWRHGLGYALAAAAAVLALAVPALILWSGGGSSDVGTPATEPPAVTESTAVPSTSAPTTTTPATTSTTVKTPDSSGTVATMDEVTFNDYTLTLTATLVDETEPQTATVSLQATPVEGSEPTDEAVVGTPAGFFWHTVTGEGAVCEFSADQTDDGAQVTVQILQGPSLGCSDPYRFLLVDGELVPDLEAPEDVAQQFVASWQAADEETMADLATADAMSQAQEMSAPTEPVFSYCEGTAGSAYCTFEDAEGELVIRVQTQPPVQVIEVIHPGN